MELDTEPGKFCQVALIAVICYPYDYWYFADSGRSFLAIVLHNMATCTMIEGSDMMHPHGEKVPRQQSTGRWAIYVQVGFSTTPITYCHSGQVNEGQDLDRTAWDPVC